MNIVTFTHGSDFIDTFIDFEWQVYKDDPTWVAPSKDTLRARFSPAFAFYEHGEIRHFLALGDKSEVLGRVSAIVNHRLHDERGPIGHVGFFEVRPDFDVARQLLDVALAHLRSRGMVTVWGPVNFATMYQYRLMTSGFDLPSFHTDPHNPPYYPDFFLRYGFKEIKRYYTDHSTRIAEIADKYLPVAAAVAGRGYSVRRADIARFDDELPVLYELISAAFDRNFGFTPLSYAEFAPLYAPYKHLLRDDDLFFAQAPDGRSIGFFLTFPDFSGQQPAGTVLAKMMGVLPGHTASGVGALMVGELLKRIERDGCQRIVSSLRIEGNVSREFAKNLYEVYKEYALYGLDL